MTSGTGRPWERGWGTGRLLTSTSNLMMIKRRFFWSAQDNNLPKLTLILFVLVTPTRLLLVRLRIWAAGLTLRWNWTLMHMLQCYIFHLYNIRRIRKFPNNGTAQILIHAFITIRLDYCNSLLYGLPATHLKKSRVQNAAARLICNISSFDHITSIYPFLFLASN